MNKWLIAFLFASVTGTQADEWHGIATGVRGGMSVNNRSETFRQVMGDVDVDLPWKWQWGADFAVKTRLDFAAGWLAGENEDAFVGSAGPSAELSWKEFPVSLELGSSPTLLSRHEFGDRDFGIPFQFTSHAGLNWDITKHFRFSYRYQHMSNAGLGTPNPGVNIHLLGLSYRF